MPRLALVSLLVVAGLTGPIAARAEPTVSLGAGGSVIVGANAGATIDVHVARWMAPTLAIAVRGGAGVLGDFHDPPSEAFVGQGAVGPLLRRCGVSTCWSVSSLVGFQRHRMTFLDGLGSPERWHERVDSLFVEGRLGGHLQFHPTVTLDASIGVRGHVVVAHGGTDGFSPHRDYWPDGVASLGLSGHF
jgi:hypothetical protein